MTDPTLDGYAKQILEHHNDRRRALDYIQQKACSMVLEGDRIDEATPKHLAALAAVIAIEPIQPMHMDMLHHIATMARNANA